MRLRRRTASAILVLAAAGVALAGCAPTPPPELAERIDGAGARNLECTSGPEGWSPDAEPA